MKTRKLLTYQLLIKEVVEQSKARFSPSIPMIKKCIEELMEKQYLERDQTDTSRLSYIA
jgi:cullin 2